MHLKNLLIVLDVFPYISLYYIRKERCFIPFRKENQSIQTITFPMKNCRKIHILLKKQDKKHRED